MSVTLIRSSAENTKSAFHAPSQICSVTYVLMISNIPTVIWMAILAFYVILEQKKSIMAELSTGPESNKCKKLEDVPYDFECLFDFPQCPTTMPRIDMETYLKVSAIQSKSGANSQSISKLEKKIDCDTVLKKPSIAGTKLIEKPKDLSPNRIVFDLTKSKEQKIDYLESKSRVSVTAKKRNSAFSVSNFIVNNESAE